MSRSVPDPATPPSAAPSADPPSAVAADLMPAWLFTSAGVGPGGPAMGGNHRTTQLLEEFAPQFELRVPPTPRGGAVGKLARFVAGAPVGLRRPLEWAKRPRSPMRAGETARRVKLACGATDSPDLCLWDSCGRRGLGRALRARGKTVIAFPHAFTSLDLPGRRTERNDPNTLGVEIADLAADADLLMTISWEETWLLRCHGLDAVWLPYFPPASVRTRMAAVRARREVNSDGPILLLGSAVFPPNAAALKRTIEYCAALPPELRSRCVVAGNGTERLTQFAEVRGLRCVGRLSDDALDDLLASAAAAIIWQPRGTGALTRVSELLLAGVPLVLNDLAARSTAIYDAGPGLTVLRRPAELAGALAAVPSTAPPPTAPRALIDAALDRIAALARSADDR